MKCLVLAGGYAKRMWPLTKDRPKPLLPVAGIPIIEYTLKKIIVLKEVKEILISTNQRFEKQFSDWMKIIRTGKKLKLIIEPTVKEEEKMGSIGGMKFIIGQEKINEDLLVVGGDNIFEFDLQKIIDFYKEKKSVVVCFHDMEDPAKVRGKFGVGILDNEGRLVEFQEKPEYPKSTFASTAIYVFPKNVLPMLFQYLEGKNNPDAPGFFINWLKDRLPVFGFVSKEKWFDIGSFEKYDEACRFYEEKSESE